MRMRDSGDRDDKTINCMSSFHRNVRNNYQVKKGKNTVEKARWSGPTGLCVKVMPFYREGGGP